MRSLFIAIVSAVVVAVITVAASVVLYRNAVDVFETEVELARQQTEGARIELALMRIELEQEREATRTVIAGLHKEVQALVAPDNDKLYTITTKGIGVTEFAVRTDSVTTTEEAAFTTDLTAAQRSDAFTQLVTIANLDAADDLCYLPIAWASAGANCDAKCAASTITCSLAGTDGLHIGPGGIVTREYDGTSCVCVVGEDVAGVPYQTERVIR